MCMLMYRQPKLSLNTISDFYFRRFKRILPTYLIVINVVLIFVILLGSPYDFPYIVREIMPSAFFYSNWPKTHVLSYFDKDSKYAIFLHTWSLSCELQFYLIFPLFFALMAALNQWLKFAFICLVIIYSFISQMITTDIDGRHMIFTGRLWQFFLGFLSHFVYESSWIQLKLKSELKRKYFLLIKNAPF
jgi:peptidoglycan/LPS O-acetylase OafA/YrhL